MAGFYGRYNLRVDDKGRVIIPAQFRDIVKNNYGNKLFITCAVSDECLHVFPDREWENMMEKVKGLPKAKESVKYFMRRVVGSAQECETDKQGRVLIPPVLREETGIVQNGEIVMVGIVDRIEIWEKKKWETIFKPDKVDVKQYSDELSDFGL
ncbi:MAG: division/cell wall cluster transcriptional repressor MraZ [Candidatus Magnetoovum sp. WYHC-5]|nr:division/cell wall cluster transcriptional repressor MraZ [Candidatus Magnetoovum sp. WYHC-5]